MHKTYEDAHDQYNLVTVRTIYTKFPVIMIWNLPYVSVDSAVNGIALVLTKENVVTCWIHVHMKFRQMDVYLRVNCHNEQKGR